MKDKRYLTRPAAWLGVQMYIHLGWGEDPGQRGIQPIICMKVHNKTFETLTEQLNDFPLALIQNALFESPYWDFPETTSAGV